jgi:hypothetical protein
MLHDPKHEYLDLLPDEDDAMNAKKVGASIAYRLALGPNAAKKSLTLQTDSARDNQTKPNELVSRQAGFTLHARVACR